MNRTIAFCLFATGLVVGLESRTAADDSGGRSSIDLRTRSAAVKSVQVLTRNLWDIVWQIPTRPIKTGKSRFDWNWLAARFDADQSSVVTREEWSASKELFANLDRTWDGKLTEADFDWSEGGMLDRQKEVTFAFIRSIDKDSDGRVTAAEWQSGFESATAEREFLNDADLEQLVFRRVVEMTQKRDQTLRERSQKRMARLEHLIHSGRLLTDGPEPGDIAPDFVLRSPDGLSQVQLSSFRDKKPVVLIFGSYT